MLTKVYYLNGIIEHKNAGNGKISMILQKKEKRKGKNEEKMLNHITFLIKRILL